MFGGVVLFHGALSVLRPETVSAMRLAASPASGMSRGTLHCMALPRIGGSGRVSLAPPDAESCVWRCTILSVHRVRPQDEASEDGNTPQRRNLCLEVKPWALLVPSGPR